MKKADLLKQVKKELNDAYSDAGLKFYEDFEDEWRVMRFKALGDKYYDDEYLTISQIRAIRLYALDNIGVDGHRRWACMSLAQAKAKRGGKAVVPEIISAPNREAAKRAFQKQHPTLHLTHIVARPAKETECV